MVAWNNKFYCLNSFGDQKYKMSLHGLKSSQSCIPSLGDNPFPCCFHFLEMAGIPWLMACLMKLLYSKPAICSISQLFSDFLPYSFIYKDPCDYKPCQIIHNNLLISRTLPYSHLQNPFCLVRFHTHRLKGLQCTHGVRWGGIILSPTVYII